MKENARKSDILALRMAEDISRLKIKKPAARKGYGRPGRKYLWWAAIAILLAVLLILASGALKTPKVRVGEVSLTYPSQGLSVLNASGYVEAERKAALASKITGRLAWLGVEEGSRVKKGQVVARLENADLAASLDSARAALKAARDGLDAAKAEADDAGVDFRRKEELLTGGFISRRDFDAAEARHRKAQAAFGSAMAQVKSAEAELRGAEASLGYADIRAPFGGVVLTKNADIGDIVTPLGAAAGTKAAVVTIADMDTLQVEADVSESNVSRISTGMPCEIQLDALPGKRFNGQVHMIVPTADRAKASVLVKVRFIEKDPLILPEMSAKVAFLSRPLGPGEDKPRMTVPSSAVTGENGRKSVFIVDNGRARKAQVTVGGAIGETVEVAGLAPGTRIVIDPPDGLSDGSRIEPLEE